MCDKKEKKRKIFAKTVLVVRKEISFFFFLLHRGQSKMELMRFLTQQIISDHEIRDLDNTTTISMRNI